MCLKCAEHIRHPFVNDVRTRASVAWESVVGGAFGFDCRFAIEKKKWKTYIRLYIKSDLWFIAVQYNTFVSAFPRLKYMAELTLASMDLDSVLLSDGSLFLLDPHRHH